MAMKTMSWLSAGTLCALLAFAGCTPNGNSNGGSAQQPVQNAQPGVQPSSGMSAPVFLNLRGPDPVPAGGNITLDVEIVVNEAVQSPVTLQVLLPQGVQLMSGQPVETLQLTQPGKLVRQYVVMASGPLTAPIVVEASAQHPNGAYGFNARREYPAQRSVVQPQQRRPPTGRPAPVRP